MYKFESEQAEYFDGKLEISLNEIPAVRLESIELPPNAGFFQKFTVATQKRHFTLAKDWQISISSKSIPDELNGVITIPARRDGTTLEFDGASVPMPWLISFLSIGALRPLGVMLIPSLVHDYAFMFGELLVAKTPDETPQPVSIERHDADNLFYGMIRTFNGDPLTARLAYMAVRVGWVFVKYNGRRRSGRFPLQTLFFSVLLLALLVLLIFPNSYIPGPRDLIPQSWFDLVGQLTLSSSWLSDFTGRVTACAILFILMYLFVYFATLIQIRRTRKRN